MNGLQCPYPMDTFIHSRRRLLHIYSEPGTVAGPRIWWHKDILVDSFFFLDLCSICCHWILPSGNSLLFSIKSVSCGSFFLLLCLLNLLCGFFSIFQTLCAMPPGCSSWVSHLSESWHAITKAECHTGLFSSSYIPYAYCLSLGSGPSSSLLEHCPQCLFLQTDPIQLIFQVVVTVIFLSCKFDHIPPQYSLSPLAAVLKV